MPRGFYCEKSLDRYAVRILPLYSIQMEEPTANVLKKLKATAVWKVECKTYRNAGEMVVMLLKGKQIPL